MVQALKHRWLVMPPSRSRTLWAIVGGWEPVHTLVPTEVEERALPVHPDSSVIMTGAPLIVVPLAAGAFF